jgi:beta-aspartyl-peptidase (threonine type)
MDGRTLQSGAVCAVHNDEHVISVARQLMERLPHVLLAGPGAERFAKELGFKKRSLLSDEAKAIYDGPLGQDTNPRFNLRRDLVNRATKDPAIAARNEDSRDLHGTVDVIAIDAKGNIASGWAWKYPGRVGD